MCVNVTFHLFFFNLSLTLINKWLWPLTDVYCFWNNERFMIFWLPVIKKIHCKSKRSKRRRCPNIIIFLPLPILDPWGEQWEKNISLTPTLLQTVYPFKIIPSDTLQPLQPKDETTTKLQRKQEGINQVNQVNTPLFEFLNLDPVFLNFCVIW